MDENQVVYAGYTRKQLSDAFDLVKPKKGWSKLTKIYKVMEE